ncbi:MAG TPA: glycosyltransferase family 4 protein [Candidatus Paceibacterota bacterium]|nr:glycosyltransferase family 4 protein [Candidatus Paceibacterota bacterium]
MKALFLSSDASIPDIASATRQRMQGYAEHIGELHVLMRSNRTQVTADEFITIHEVRMSKWLSLLLLPRYARQIIRVCGIEVVSAQDPFEHGYIGLRAVRGTSAKLHIQVHTDFLSPWFTHGYSRQALLNHLRFWLASYVLPKADGIRAVAPRVKRSMMAKFGARIKEPSVLPVLVLDDDTERAELEPPFAVTLLVLGRLEPEKRFRDALHILAVLRKTHPEAGLIIAGEGSEGASLRNEAHALGIEGWVRFLGMRSDVSQLMRASHVLLQTSAYEGYSRTLVEAARTGLPIVTTDVGIVSDVLIPNTHVLVSHVGDVMSFVENVRRIVDDPALAISLKTAAQEVVLAHLKAYEHQAVMIAHDLRDTFT